MKITHSPWGAPQSTKHIGHGITWISTASHGGFYVPPDALAMMPEPVRNAETFAGESWYEEDCDWGLVALAFPSLFTPAELFSAIRTARGWHTEDAGLQKWIDTTHGAWFADYYRQHGENFTVCCEGTAGGKGWRVMAESLDGERTVRFSAPVTHGLPLHFTLADIERIGRDIKVIQKTELPA